jgi:hypothetical protein
MCTFRRLRWHQRSIAVLLLLLWLPACHSWRVPGVAPAAYVEQQHPARVRLSTDTNRVQLDHPWVRADTIVGTRWIATNAGLMRVDTVAVPGPQISRMEVRKSDTGKTLLLTGGILATVIALAAVAMSGFNLDGLSFPID